jgi:mutator protein MutT
MSPPPDSSSGLPVVEVAAGLIFRDNRLLLAQRPEGAHLAGLWEFPGGKREPGETWEHCLQRELREELGVGVAVGECVLEQTHDYPARRVVLRFFRCRLTEGEPSGLDRQALAWVTPGELTNHTFPPADEALVRRLRSEPDLWR